jgi:hypothetical protein
MSTSPDDLDAPLYGAEAIGREARILDEDGNVDLRRVYHAAAQGYLDVSKFGRLLVSTPRRIRRAFAGNAVWDK